MAKTMRIHWPLINLGILFLIPILAAGYMLVFKNYQQIHTVQHGTFIQTPYKLATHAQMNKWTLIYVQPESCNTICKNQQQVLHNLHVALGAARDRVAIISTTTAALNMQLPDHSLLIINPQGLYIMRYNGIVDHLGLLKDLRRLLKYSHA